MTQIYASYANAPADQKRAAAAARVSRRTATLAICGLSLLGWVPVVIPLIAIFHQ